MAFRILLLGGYGVFGRRIHAALACDPSLSLVLAGRDPSRAPVLPACAETLALDHRDPALAERIAQLGADLVIHCCGPFQGQDYHVAMACIAAGAHYIDLADGREFVAGIGALDSAARAAGRIIVSGASTLPGLSSAVVQHCRARFSRLEHISISIAPGRVAAAGMATTRTVLGYCGEPMRQLEDGAWRTVHGWQDLRRMDYGAAGRRYAGVCDVPDLSVLPQHGPALQSVTFHAAPPLTALQLSLWVMAWLRRLRLAPRWSCAARPLHRLGHWLDRFTGDSGAMHVELSGLGVDGQALRLRWELIARDDHGPHVPTIPAIILARRLAAGAGMVSGARACVGLFSLEDFSAATAGLNIEWRVVTVEA